MVRTATIEDIPRLLELGKEFYESTRLAAHIDYDPISTCEFLESLITGAVSIVFVVERSGLIVGGIGGCAVPSYWNKQHIIAQQLFMYLDAAHRGTAASGLLKSWERWAEIRGASLILSGWKHDPALGRAPIFFKIMGYEPLEYYCMKGVSACH